LPGGKWAARIIDLGRLEAVLVRRRAAGEACTLGVVAARARKRAAGVACTQVVAAVLERTLVVTAVEACTLVAAAAGACKLVAAAAGACKLVAVVVGACMQELHRPCHLVVACHCLGCRALGQGHTEVGHPQHR